MKKFGKRLVLLVAILITLLFLCDFVYTQVYLHSHPRNKLQYILKTEKRHFDVVFLGSSRVANHIDTRLFDSLSGKRTINLGVEGAGLNDNLLELKLLLANQNHVSNLFLQLDANFESTNPSNISIAEAMPYTDNEIIIQHIKKYFKNERELLYIPFYRYALNDPKIGLRELFFSLINKKPSNNLEIGFIPKFGNYIPAIENSLPETIRNSNSVLDEIIAICKAHDVKLVLFTTPYCSKTNTNGYIEKLKIKFPDLLDLSTGYSDTLFYDCGHLNEKGATILTEALYSVTRDKLKKESNR
ncbi:hypothetical protein [Flavobacterium cerinum]|uniref:SGNH/GDSL hydrolase family protein n=1 Tax=Flavobacterium cerinum TaxID=2502784 RepID=A0ABY5IS38_9FLAO|nr:hypothetical protein [Flavobacterium cerinum]UUC45101.1 hypothetical protein NOX80_15930 [Flavobacterium cerinum]